MEKKRTPPEPVTPVTHKGIRYEAVHWGKARGLEQNGGYVAAVDASSGEELRLLRVYGVAYDDDREPDKQDVFITRLARRLGSNKLTVENERGERYRVDLETGDVVDGD
jgi:hypothetical protein